MSDIVRELKGYGQRIGQTEVKEVPLTNIGARVYNSANISIPHNTTTIVTFDSERYDPEGLHSISSNTGRFTLTRGGNYALWAMVRWEAIAGGDRDLAIRYNGTTAIADDTRLNVTASVLTMTIATAWYNCAAGDTFELLAYQNQGGAVNLLVASAYSPEFAIARLL